MKPRTRARRIARQLQDQGWPWREALVEAGHRVAEADGRFERPDQEIPDADGRAAKSMLRRRG